MKIALTFSGGGYRAAGFNLGTLSYLYLVPFGENQTLADQVMTLSTVSGGTITGVRYAIGLQRGESFQITFKGVYEFLANTELVKQALGNLCNDDQWRNGRIRSLINSFADVYHSELFNGALFGELMASDETRQLKNMSFNATEFANGLQFRFQWSEKMLKPTPNEYERGIVGNLRYPLPDAIAAQIRLADITAASSCFPAGFEPINFPGDFLSAGGDISWMKGMALPVGLMDGGIVDNQGIEPVLLAEARMQRNLLASTQDDRTPDIKPSAPALDLIMISDVASPYMAAYQQSKENKKGWLRKTKLDTLLAANTLLGIVGIGAVVWTFQHEKMTGLVVSTMVATLSAALFGFIWFLGRLPARLKLPKEFLKPLGSLLRLPLYVYESLLLNRVNSFKMLAMNIFLKHVRAMNYSTIYEDPQWHNRRIMCAVYELKNTEINKRQQVPNALPPELVPSQGIMDIAAKAAAFGTTLWFTDEDIRADMLNTLIACGQVTACWNLLEYISKLKTDSENTNAEHVKLMACEAVIRKHWNALQIDPYILLKEYGIIEKQINSQVLQ